MRKSNSAVVKGGNKPTESQQHSPERFLTEVAEHRPAHPTPHSMEVHTSGSTVSPRYGERRLAFYHVTQNELDTISSLNADALRDFSIGSFLIALTFEIYISAAFTSTPPSDLGRLALEFVGPTSGVVALIFFGFGFHSIRRRRSTIDRVKEETRLAE